MALSMPELTVTSPRRRRIKVSCDGEVVRMLTPLEFRIRPGALQVLVPAPVGEEGPP
jgi:diacylglycerol kinase family enzyme